MSSIKAIIFDVDGTLYKPIPELSNEFHQYWIKRISDYLRIPEDQAEVRYSDLKKKYKSATLALASLGIGNPREIIIQAEHHMRSYHREYILKDRELIKVLKILKHHYTLATLRNGTRAGTRFILSLIGFSERRDKWKRGFGPFDHILPTVELGPTKPDPQPFQNALKQLALAPNEILVIGDRVEVDLTPAKRFGMKTVFVDWGRNLSYNKADVDSVIDTIYEVEQLIP
ncbi:MAG: HAD-superfamily hydrolase, subfamily IA, variant 1 [Candidatus Roizmanbacteria bacterium GW2011_GWB1_40_7]|uniref:HAD-superfamily hydrolase, subfamily IA, variant 1 n=2 Tax=Candidatus Roizmaniibacteriota TaxID=1752723 RepID=A0A0G0XA21_9BACT|nr:MAG: HAD-superfamily hydrolase, subfamily IA, variant 1 [Candidatus Roizmanbacteria bacterium GW2011_GWB1_40_7]KKS21212.1 MAG: HAD-superfamily hydrolase, subfamily IA, variant 1 [Candidatus Roizmanbacteria bacterium GW2011_GWC2_41_7]